MPEFWRSCDLAVVPSDRFVESFSMTTLEAMASGVPVVATRNGGITEVARRRRDRHDRSSRGRNGVEPCHSRLRDRPRAAAPPRYRRAGACCRPVPHRVDRTGVPRASHRARTIMKESLDFIVIGAQKSGTTTLFEHLRLHPISIFRRGRRPRSSATTPSGAAGWERVRAAVLRRCRRDPALGNGHARSTWSARSTNRADPDRACGD